MYLQAVNLENWGPFSNLEVSFPEHQLPGWHVIIGDNGAGKTSFLQGISIALFGPGKLGSLPVGPNRLIKLSQEKAQTALSISQYYFHPSKHDTDIFQTFTQVYFEETNDTPFFEFKSWGSREGAYNKPGNHWRSQFSAAFGPSRKLVTEKRRTQAPAQDFLAEAHMSLFDPDWVFVDVINWLKDLRLDQLEKERSPEPSFLDLLIEFINQDDFLPNNFKLVEIGSNGILLQTPDGTQLPFEWLSDGYKSILAFTLELIRLYTTFPNALKGNSLFQQHEDGHISVRIEGPVLIDEIDAHLHPTWQVRIGQWLTKHFPKVQFIVTTHSPLICRAAKYGSVWRLAAPGSGENAEQITGTDLDRLIYGNVLDAYGTEAFGSNITSSAEATYMRERLAQLNKKSIKGTITERENEELRQIKTTLPTGG